MWSARHRPPSFVRMNTIDRPSIETNIRPRPHEHRILVPTIPDTFPERKRAILEMNFVVERIKKRRKRKVFAEFSYQFRTGSRDEWICSSTGPEWVEDTWKTGFFREEPGADIWPVPLLWRSCPDLGRIGERKIFKTSSFKIISSRPWLTFRVLFGHHRVDVQRLRSIEQTRTDLSNGRKVLNGMAKLFLHVTDEQTRTVGGQSAHQFGRHCEPKKEVKGQNVNQLIGKGSFRCPTRDPKRRRQVNVVVASCSVYGGLTSWQFERAVSSKRKKSWWICLAEISIKLISNQSKHSHFLEIVFLNHWRRNHCNDSGESFPSISMQLTDLRLSAIPINFDWISIELQFIIKSKFMKTWLSNRTARYQHLFAHSPSVFFLHANARTPAMPWRRESSWGEHTLSSSPSSGVLILPAFFWYNRLFLIAKHRSEIIFDWLIGPSSSRSRSWRKGFLRKQTTRVRVSRPARGPFSAKTFRNPFSQLTFIVLLLIPRPESPAFSSPLLWFS